MQHVLRCRGGVDKDGAHYEWDEHYWDDLKSMIGKDPSTMLQYKYYYRVIPPPRPMYMYDYEFEYIPERRERVGVAIFFPGNGGRVVVMNDLKFEKDIYGTRFVDYAVAELDIKNPVLENMVRKILAKHGFTGNGNTMTRDKILTDKETVKIHEEIRNAYVSIHKAKQRPPQPHGGRRSKHTAKSIASGSGGEEKNKGNTGESIGVGSTAVQERGVHGVSSLVYRVPGLADRYTPRRSRVEPVELNEDNAVLVPPKSRVVGDHSAQFFYDDGRVVLPERVLRELGLIREYKHNRGYLVYRPIADRVYLLAYDYDAKKREIKPVAVYDVHGVLVAGPAEAAEKYRRMLEYTKIYNTAASTIEKPDLGTIEHYAGIKTELATRGLGSGEVVGAKINIPTLGEIIIANKGNRYAYVKINTNSKDTAELLNQMIKPVLEKHRFQPGRYDPLKTFIRTGRSNLLTQEEIIALANEITEKLQEPENYQKIVNTGVASIYEAAKKTYSNIMEARKKLGINKPPEEPLETQDILAILTKPKPAPPQPQKTQKTPATALKELENPPPPPPEPPSLDELLADWRLEQERGGGEEAVEEASTAVHEQEEKTQEPRTTLAEEKTEEAAEKEIPAPPALPVEVLRSLEEAAEAREEAEESGTAVQEPVAEKEEEGAGGDRLIEEAVRRFAEKLESITNEDLKNMLLRKGYEESVLISFDLPTEYYGSTTRHIKRGGKEIEERELRETARFRTLRRRFYMLLHKIAYRTPAGWILIDNNPPPEIVERLNEVMRELNRLAGTRRAVYVIEAYLPRSVLRRWINDNIVEIKADIERLKEKMQEKIRKEGEKTRAVAKITYEIREKQRKLEQLYRKLRELEEREKQKQEQIRRMLHT